MVFLAAPENMPDSPAITVLMPAYNAGSYIREAIESVLGQTLTDFEFLIIDDGSKDDTLPIIRSYSDARIRVISRPNRGLIDTLNEGLGAAKADFIARHDADDIMLPHRLQRQYEFLVSHPEYAIVGSDVAYVDKDGRYVSTQLAPDGHTDEEIKENRFYKCPFLHPSVLFRKDAIVAAGGYPLGALQFEDWLLWIRVMEHHKVCNLPETLVQMRINPESVTIDERWRRKEFHELRQNALAQGSISEKEASRLAAVVRTQNFNTYKKASYHASLAKKYLWDNHQPRLARQHLREAIKTYPGSREPYMLYLISFLPAFLIRGLYKATKRK